MFTIYLVANKIEFPKYGSSEKIQECDYHFYNLFGSLRVKILYYNFI